MNRTLSRKRRVRPSKLGIILSLPLVLVAAACSSSSPGSSSSSKLSVAVIDWQVPLFKPVMTAYKKADPSVQTQLISLPADDTTRLQTLLAQKASNSLACVVITEDDQATAVYKAGVTTDLTPLLNAKNGLTASEFVPAPLSNYRPITATSKITGLPTAIDGTVVFYNEKLFKEAGVPLPTANWTWSQMIADAAAITKAGHGKYYGIVGGNPGSSDGNPWQAVYNSMIDAFGGSVYNPKTNTSGIGTPAADRAWQLVMQMYGPAGVPYDITNSAASPQFASGKVAMQIDVAGLDPDLVGVLHDPWNVISLPTVNGSRPIGGGSLALSISSDCQNRTAAWNFLKWYFSDKGGQAVAQTISGDVPPTYHALKTGVWLKQTAPPANKPAFAYAAEHIRVASDMPSAAAVTALSNAINEATQKVEIDHASIASAFSAAEQQVNTALASSSS